MSIKAIIAGLVGGIAYWVMGYVCYVILFGGYFGKHHGEGLKIPYDMWAIVVGCVLFALLLALIFERWANISTLKSGAIAGAVIGLLAHLSADFVRFGDSTFFDSLTPAILNSVVQAIMSTVAGAVVGIMLGMGKKS